MIVPPNRLPVRFSSKPVVVILSSVLGSVLSVSIKAIISPSVTTPATPDTLYAQSESRISLLTLLLGLGVAAPIAALHHWQWAMGILIGSALAWLNFRWLKDGLDALTAAATGQHGQEKIRVPISTYLKALFRYALIALCTYVIFRYLHVPALSIVCGLCALGAATLLVSVHSIVCSTD